MISQELLATQLKSWTQAYKLYFFYKIFLQFFRGLSLITSYIFYYLPWHGSSIDFIYYYCSKHLGLSGFIQASEATT